MKQRHRYSETRTNKNKHFFRHFVEKLFRQLLVAIFSHTNQGQELWLSCYMYNSYTQRQTVVRKQIFLIFNNLPKLVLATYSTHFFLK